MGGQTMLTEEAQLRRETEEKINSSISSDPGRLFAVIHVRGHQHKVTTGDLVMVLTDIGATIGSRVRLEKLQALGSKDFTLLGRPLLPRDLAVLEKTLSRTKVVQKFIQRSQHRMFRFARSKWSLLRINGITLVTPVGQTLDREGIWNSIDRNYS